MKLHQMIFAALVGVFFAANAWAGVPGVITNVEFDPPDFGTASIDPFGDVTITGSTSFDPTADPILKIFTTNGGGPFFRLDETITNNGPTAWTDWHEELLVSDGSGGWTPSTPGDGLFFESVSLNSPGGDVQFTVGDDMAWIFFDNPVLQGESIDITKFIAVPFGMKEFAIAEYPTVPVPAAVWLFGSGLIGLIGIARKRKTA
jgi:hypothetical protein